MMTRKTPFLLVVLSLLVSSSGCMMMRHSHHDGKNSASIEGDVWTREELYFGTAIPGGGVVSDSAWQQFVDGEITPRFPDGFTVLDASGQYRMATGETVKERTKIVVLVYLRKNEQSAAINKKIEEIIETYKRTFNQESVLRVRSTATTKF